MPDALDLLKTRRSVKPMELEGPAPVPSEIDTLLKIASRVPDHGKLAPWRFIVFEGNARAVAGDTIAAAYRADHPEATPDQIEFERKRLSRAPLVIAVVSRAGPHVKIPEWEQQLSAGASAIVSSLPRTPWAMPRAGLRSGTLTIGEFSMRLALRRMNELPASFILAGR